MDGWPAVPGRAGLRSSNIYVLDTQPTAQSAVAQNDPGKRAGEKQLFPPTRCTAAGWIFLTCLATVSGR